jgi:tetratricopeptide (TPR) repeat protein
MAAHEYSAAEQSINELMDDGYHDHATIHALARCQLALEQHDEALNNYTHLLHHADEADLKSRAEAALILDKHQQALPLFQAAIKQSPNDKELLFFLALAEYKLGIIQHAVNHLRDAVRFGLGWDDNDPHDFVAQQALPIRDFHDFEQLYLDAVESVQENKENPQNRWFSINMPIFEIYAASSQDRQKKRAADFAKMLGQHFDDLFLSNGRNELWRIFDDLSNSDTNPEFGKEAREALKNEEYTKIAKLILALHLDHLKQFADSFGLTADHIDQSNLQGLIPLLPLRLAVALMFLYSTGNPEDKPPNYQNKLEHNTLAALLAACFISYYQQVETYRSRKQKSK